MHTFKGTVYFHGGGETDFEIGALPAMSAYEEYALRHNYPYGDATPPALLTLMAAWKALGTQEGFDVWRQTVFGVEMDEEPVPPTLPVALDGSVSS